MILSWISKKMYTTFGSFDPLPHRDGPFYFIGKANVSINVHFLEYPSPKMSTWIMHVPSLLRGRIGIAASSQARGS